VEGKLKLRRKLEIFLMLKVSNNLSFTALTSSVRGNFIDNERGKMHYDTHSECHHSPSGKEKC